MKKYLFYIIVLIIINNVFAGWEAVRSKNGMVASADKYATEAGLEILKNGGNAVDAAITVGFVLAVTYPQAGNIGGGGFMLIQARDNFFALDYREKAPKAAFRDLYLDDSSQVIENASTIGYRASGVPGTVAGLYKAHKKFGNLSWDKVIEPAIQFAENGFPINRFKERSLDYHYDTFLQFSSTKEIFTKNDQKYKEGDFLIQKDLATTLKLIQVNGKDGFYAGVIAELIEEDQKNNNGLIRMEDLEDYDAIWRDPIKYEYHNYTIYSMPPPSSGGVILAEILNGLEIYNLGLLGHNSSDLIHIWVEIERRAYSDRAIYLGDSDFIEVPVEKLISKEYASEKFVDINPYISTKSISEKNVIISESEETTHFSIIDKWGNAVSNTYTLNGSYGCGVVIKGTGILMNNEMDDFSIKPGVPNMFGLVGGEANSIAPEKRMLSSMTPTIVTKNDSIVLIVGSPGGSTIITSVAQVISNIIDHNLNVRMAVESPRFHHQWLPDEIRIEQNGFSKDVINNLTNRGHKIIYSYQIGDIQAILWDSLNNEWTGWSDPRGNGLTKGY